MRVKSHGRRLRPADPVLTRLLLLGGCAVLGMLAGGLYAARCQDDSFSAYLADFCELFAGGAVSVSPVDALRLFFGPPALALLLGSAALGVVLIPLLAAGYGFSAMFAVSCFVRAFGRQGALLAFGATGLRHLFVLPCFLWLAAGAWAASDRLFCLALGRGKRCAPAGQTGFRAHHVFLCVVILLAGLWAEYRLTPRLFALMLGA